MTITFFVSNRRGLGHLMRADNLARELADLAPDEPLHLCARRQPPAWLGASWSRIEIGEPTYEPTGEGPQVQVHDTRLPERMVSASHVRHVYVMRRQQTARQEEVLADPRLSEMDLILIPHSPEDFGHEVPTELMDRCRYVGPIVRRPDPAVGATLRRELGLEPDRLLWVSSAGGGGFTEEARAFFDIARAAHERLATQGTSFEHVIILGPSFEGEVTPPPGATVVREVPDLVNLLAISDVLLARGGYNTVTELQMTGTPSVLLPAARKRDDQYERVLSLAEKGLAIVPGSMDGSSAVEAIVGLCTSVTDRERLREELAAHRLTPGNREAAERILALSRNAGEK